VAVVRVAMDHIQQQALVEQVAVVLVLMGLAQQLLQLLARLIQEVVVAGLEEIKAHQVQAAPALLFSSTPYQAKPYLRSKALLSGHARQVLPALTILWLLVVALVVMDQVYQEVAEVVEGLVVLGLEPAFQLPQARNIP